jgi:hypothetical protein
MLDAILRAFSYIYHLLISVVLLALSLVAFASDNYDLKQDLLPWTGKELFYWMLGLGFLGLISLILCFLGKVRVLFPVWALIVVIGLVRGIIFSGMHFASATDFYYALCFIGAGLIALLGAWSAFRKRA